MRRTKHESMTESEKEELGQNMEFKLKKFLFEDNQIPFLQIDRKIKFGEISSNCFKIVIFPPFPKIETHISKM